MISDRRSLRYLPHPPLALFSPGNDLELYIVSSTRPEHISTTIISLKKEFEVLEEKDIKVGDTVRTAYRGGERKGVVKEIATTDEEHPYPPKFIFDRERLGQEPKEVAHNPSTLKKVDKE